MFCHWQCQQSANYAQRLAIEIISRGYFHICRGCTSHVRSVRKVHARTQTSLAWLRM